MSAPIFEVGEPYIFPMDRPSGYWCVVVTHESGLAQYLCIHHGRRWPHTLNLAKLGPSKAVSLATYGVEVSKDATGLFFEQKQPSSATYRDGKPQRWQPEFQTRERLLFFPHQPKRLRMESRAKRRWRHFCNVREVCPALTFKDYLAAARASD